MSDNGLPLRCRNRPDVGWHQIRNALNARGESGDTAPVHFVPFEQDY